MAEKPPDPSRKLFLLPSEKERREDEESQTEALRQQILAALAAPLPPESTLRRELLEGFSNMLERWGEAREVAGVFSIDLECLKQDMASWEQLDQLLLWVTAQAYREIKAEDPQTLETPLAGNLAQAIAQSQNDPEGVEKARRTIEERMGFPTKSYEPLAALLRLKAAIKPQPK